MQSQDKINHHATLVDRMASKRGLDLDEKTMQGQLPPEQLSEAVLRCTGCACPNECETWLAEKTAPQQATPSYCRNQDLFDQLGAPKAG
ncbi:DUF6455 family protein [Thalassovita sp.]|jgi:hypothetical protein|uniref:DUF6455 family protein n=1 Tax=Thalassovita sp. TaxID=1979401 RepID=UPI003B58BA75